MSQEQCCPDYSPSTEVWDPQSGDCICTMCGRVLESHMMVHTYDDIGRTSEPSEFGSSVIHLDKVRGVQKSTIAMAFREDNTGKTRMVTGIRFVEELARYALLSEQTVFWGKELMRDSLVKNSVRADTKLRYRAAGCLYFACKLDGVDRGENELADQLAVPRKEMQKSNKQLRKLLASKPYAREMLQGVRPRSLIPRLLQAAKTLLPEEVRIKINWQRARTNVEELAHQVEVRCNLDGKKPQSVCAALLVKTLEPWGMTSHKIAAICGVSVGAVDSALADVKSLDETKKI